jgi:phosphate transport system substrate-binding protein
MIFVIIIALILLVGCFIPNKIVHRIARTLVIGFLIFIAFLFGFIFGTDKFGLAGLLTSFVVTAALSVITLVLVWRMFSPKVRKIIIAASGGVSAVFLCFTFISTGIDNSLALTYTDTYTSNFNPFTEGNRLARLDSPADIKFDENFPLPNLDGATALFPYYAAAFQETYYPPYSDFLDPAFEDKYRAQYKYLANSNSENSFWRMIPDGYVDFMKVDIVFLAGLTEAQKQYAAEQGVELEITPIGKEAFVFIVNENNKAANVTTEQLRQIYNGEITNWKDIGGYNARIKLYMLRGENMGSNLALRQFLGVTAPPDYIERVYFDVMGGVTSGVADYRNYRSSLGYSYRYYVQIMTAQNNIKMLSVDGIAPTEENIRNGSYPFTGEFVAVSRADNDNPNVQILLDWLQGEQGQELLEKTGYVRR